MGKRKVNKLLTAVISLGALIFLLVACSSGENTSTGSASDSNGEPVTIRFSFDQGVGEPTQKIVDQYNESQDKVNVETVILPQDANVVHDDFVNKLASGDTSVDVMALDVVYVAEFASANWLEDLTPYFDESRQSEFLSGTIEGATYDDKLVSVPWFTNASVLFYRKDVLDQIGAEVPTTYQGWMDIADEAKEVDEIEYLASFQAAQSEAMVTNWVEYIWNNGGEVLDESGQSVVNSENNIEATKIMKDLVENYAPEGVTTYNEPESEQVFLEGKSLFLRDWSGFWSIAHAEGSKIADKIGATTLPVGPNGEVPHSSLGGLNLIINKHIDETHKEAAVDFLNYLTSVETQKEMTLISSQPPVIKSVYTDEEILEEIPFYEDFYGVIQDGKTRPKSPQYAKVSDAIQRNIHQTLSGEMDVEAALDQLDKELEELN